MATIEYIPMAPNHRAFVASTWLQSYRERSGVAPSVYQRHHPRLIDALLDRADTRMAVSGDDHDTVLGYACGLSGVLHYAYVVPPLRGDGIAGLLIDGVAGPVAEVTHRWPYQTRWIFNPYLSGVSV